MTADNTLFSPRHTSPATATASTTSFTSEEDDDKCLASEKLKQQRLQRIMKAQAKHPSWASKSECFLLISLFAYTLLTIDRDVLHSATHLPNHDFLRNYTTVFIALLSVSWSDLKFPDFVYEFVLPPLLALIFNPSFLQFNMILGLAAFPVRYYFLKVINLIFLRPELSGTVWDIHYFIFEATSEIVGVSLSKTEIWLVSSLLVNLLSLTVSRMGIVLQTAFFGSVFVLWLLAPVFESLLQSPSKRDLQDIGKWQATRVKSARIFGYGYFIGMLAFALPMLTIRLDDSTNAIWYLISVMFNFLNIVLFWICILIVLVPLTHYYTLHYTLKTNTKRKIFHFISVAMFLPIFSISSGNQDLNDFLYLCFSAVLILFLIIEIIRITSFPSIGQTIHEFLDRYCDERDRKGKLIVSHIYLLLGIALPLFFCYSDQKLPLDSITDNFPSLYNPSIYYTHTTMKGKLPETSIAAISGLLSLGLGDSFASIVGKSIGKYKYPGMSKTIEGTIGFFISVFIGMILTMTWRSAYFEFIQYDIIPSFNDVWIIICSIVLEFSGRISIVAIGTALMEAFGSMNDNLIVPVYMMALIKVVGL